MRIWLGLVLALLLSTPARAQVTVAIDTPASGVSQFSPFSIAGWAIDRRSAAGPGVDVVHVWAFPQSGGPAVFLDDAPLTISRPDVAAAYGPQFGTSGYTVYVTTPTLRGRYTVGVYAHSTITGGFDGVQFVVVDFAITAFVASAIDSVLVMHYSEFDLMVVTGWAMGCSVDVFVELEVDGQVVSHVSPSETSPRPDVWAVYAPLGCTNAGAPIGRYAVRAVPRLALGDHVVRWRVSYGPIPPLYVDAVACSSEVPFHVDPIPPPMPMSVFKWGY